MSDLTDRLKSVYLFEGFTDRELEQVVKRSRVVDHETGHEVVEQDRGSAAFHLILDGTASVVRDGRTLATLKSGDYFGEVSLIDGKPRSATVRADGPLKTLSIVSWQFTPLLEEQPKLTHKILLGFCNRLRQADLALGAVQAD